jgi:hypothetical protein
MTAGLKNVRFGGLDGTFQQCALDVVNDPSRKPDHDKSHSTALQATSAETKRRGYEDVLEGESGEHSCRYCRTKNVTARGSPE